MYGRTPRQQIGRLLDWTDLRPMLGKPDGQSEGDVWLDLPPGKGRAFYRVAWFR